MTDFLKCSGLKLAKLMKNGEASSFEICNAHIERIKAVNPKLNAVVKDRFKEALGEAKAADEILKRDDPSTLPPYFGVPFTVKECFALTGMPNSSGLVARKDVISQQDATVVERIRKAGAIPLGVTNISELCMWMESNNKVYGRTRNPHDPSRTVGGSSGGEGAIIGAGGSPFGVGSDIGGSIRMPAFFNGIYGHKPTGGLVPNSGQFPTTHSGAVKYQTTGPLARSSEDLWPLLKIMAGPDGIDPGCDAMKMKDPADVDFKKMTVFSVEGNGWIKASDELIGVQRNALKALGKLGAFTETIEIKELKDSLGIWSSMLGAAGEEPFGAQLGEGKPINALLELVKWVPGVSPFTLPAIGLAGLEDLIKLLPDSTEKFIKKGEQLRAKMSEMLGDSAMMLYPPYPTVAPKHIKPIFPPFNWVYTAIINVLEFPVTQVPLGFNKDGIPLGVQIIGNHGCDHITVAAAKALEKAY